MHEQFDRRLAQLVEASSLVGAQVGAEALAEVLSRVFAVAPEETSRWEIATGADSPGAAPERQLPIPQGTVSKAVKALMHEGLLQDGVTFIRTGTGRTLSPVRLSSTLVMAGATVTVQDGRPCRVSTVLTGLDGTVLRTRHSELTGSPVGGPAVAGEDGEDESGSEDAAWEQVARVVHRDVGDLLRRHDQQRSRRGESPVELFGLGISLGAHVHDGTIIRSADGRPDHVVALADAVQALFAHEVPVVLESDVNALALAAAHDLRHAGPDVVTVAVFDDGVDGAVITGGRLRRGSTGRAMRIGHLRVGPLPNADDRGQPGTPLPDVGPEGTRGASGRVDDVAAPRRLRTVLDVDTDAQAAQLPARDLDGRPSRAGVLFRGSGAVLGRALAHVVDLVDPSRLLLHVPSAWADLEPDRAASAYLAAATEELQRAHPTVGQDGTVTIHPLLTDQDGLERQARDAAVCLFHSFLEHARGIDGCRGAQRRTHRTAPD